MLVLFIYFILFSFSQGDTCVSMCVCLFIVLTFIFFNFIFTLLCQTQLLHIIWFPALEHCFSSCLLKIERMNKGLLQTPIIPSSPLSFSSLFDLPLVLSKVYERQGPSCKQCFPCRKRFFNCFPRSLLFFSTKSFVWVFLRHCCIWPLSPLFSSPVSGHYSIDIQKIQTEMICTLQC